MLFIECEQSLRQRNDECKKLSTSLEQQQGSVLCKLNDLSETYDFDKKQSEAIIAHLEESEKELIAKVGKLQQVINRKTFKTLTKSCAVSDTQKLHQLSFNENYVIS